MSALLPNGASPRRPLGQPEGVTTTDFDADRIDDAVLALLLLGPHGGYQVWKSFDWEAMNRLHERGLISDPVGKAKSVVLTEEGQPQRCAERLFEELFAARR